MHSPTPQSYISYYYYIVFLSVLRRTRLSSRWLWIYYIIIICKKEKKYHHISWLYVLLYIYVIYTYLCFERTYMYTFTGCLGVAFVSLCFSCPNLLQIEGSKQMLVFVSYRLPSGRM